MTDDDFDKEIKELYQQRKQQLDAPKITFKQPTQSGKLSLFRWFSIFAIGGTASFGILAIVTYFATPPVKNPQSVNALSAIEVDTFIEEKVEPPVIVVKPPLPAKPEVMVVKQTQIVALATQNKTELSKPTSFTVSDVQKVTLPQLREPILSILPIYKVMPKYSIKPDKKKQTGIVKLRYRIGK